MLGARDVVGHRLYSFLSAAILQRAAKSLYNPEKKGANMSETTLESLAERISALEAAVARIQQQPGKSSRLRDWRRTRGIFAGDEVMKEIFDAGRTIREEERQENGA
jgi:hypothetical protein